MQIKKKYNHFILLSSFLFLLNCGGGGVGGVKNSSSSLRVITEPHYDSGTSLTENSNTGSYTASDYEAADFGAYSLTLSESSKSFGGVVANKSESGNFSIKTDHMTDTAATTAWSQGWTGQNTSIHIIDDFTNEYSSKLVIGSFTSTRTVVDSGVTSTHDVTYTASIPYTHGWLVSQIAGGDKATETHDVTYEVTDWERKSCTSSGSSCFAYYWKNTPGTEYLVNYDGFSDLSSSNQSIIFAPGVAKDSSVTNSNVSSTLSFSNWYSYLEGHIRNSSSFDAVNLSWGVKAAGLGYRDFTSGNSDFADYNNTKSVFVVAAGNDGAPCTENNFVDCNLLAVDLALDSSLGDQVIIAGALNSAGTSIATYSNRAGVMKDRYLMAVGDTGYDNQAGNDIVGTSFAAPRITGAAALLKSKFQNLTGAQAADILLLTADKDIDGNGSDDFSGISNIYGHGKLDTGSALSPIGNLYSY